MIKKSKIEENYVLVWSDEFDGETINEDYWNFEIGNGNWGWGNGELQYYTKPKKIIKIMLRGTYS